MSGGGLEDVLTSLECIEKIFIYTEGITSGEHLFEKNDQLNYNAVIKMISVIGEEISKVDPKLLMNHHIDWQAIKGTRNRIVHDYRGLDTRGFNCITYDFPSLCTY